MASNSTTFNLKLLIDTKANKVLFAEVGKEVVDFLFSLLALPLGTIVKLVISNESMVGSIGNLYKSVESLDESYLIPYQNKSSLLSPKTIAKNTTLLLAEVETEVENCTEAHISKYYRCSTPQCGNYVTDKYESRCPNCLCKMRTEMTFVGAARLAESFGIGFVKGVVTYTVMDDLLIMPMSTISSITMLSKFGVKDIGSLVEKHVELDIKQGLKMLNASLQSKTVLTDVFLSNKHD